METNLHSQEPKNNVIQLADLENIIEASTVIKLQNAGYPDSEGLLQRLEETRGRVRQQLGLKIH